MSVHECTEPVCRHAQGTRLIVDSAAHDLGGFSVRRVLPASEVKQVGPFVFFDEMGPAEFSPGKGINVRPHPHIGLSTVTFLFDGEIMHRDSLGFQQPIRPGAVNLMTAGRGIVHSERTSEELMATGQTLHGIQVWMALSIGMEEIEPAFRHYPASEIPVIDSGNASVSVIIGGFGGQHSPVDVLPETLYLAMQLTGDYQERLSFATEQLGIYVVSGAVTVNECEIQPGAMAIVSPASVDLSAATDATVMVIGGEDVGPRHKYWNFVHSSPQQIEAAKVAWQNGQFAMIDGDPEFIPLPD